MISGKQLRGLPVWQQNGKQLGRVLDALAHPDGTVSGFLVESGGLLRRRRWLPATDAALLDQSGLWLADTATLQTAEAAAPGQTLRGLLGRGVQDGSGRPLGVLADVWLEDGALQSVELSNGLAADLRHGHSFLAWQNLSDQVWQSET